MPDTVTPVWEPLDEAEKALKEAFTGLTEAATKVIVQGLEDNPNRFILNSKGYYDLRAYVLTGKDFPQTAADFEAKMPKDAFAKLTAIDPEIYERTRDAMVKVGSSCTEYYKDGLTKLVQAAKAAANYSKNALKLLAESKEINLLAQLKILMDPDYEGQETSNKRFKDALASAQMTLSMLEEDAQAKGAEVKEICDKLIKFRDATQRQLDADKFGVKYLIQQYLTGPVTNNSHVETPYLEYLNADMAATIKDFNATVKEAEKKHGEWEKARDTAIGTAFAGPIGWIAMGIYSARAKDLETKYKRLKAKMAQLEKTSKGTAALITYVTQLTTQCDGIDDKMETAIKAMNDLADLFYAHADCYNHIGKNLHAMFKGTEFESADNRRAWINSKMEEAITNLQELRDLAGEFAKAIIRNIDLAPKA